MLELSFITRSLLAGFGIAIAAGPLGALLVWQRLSYFGDVLAHSTLLGVGLAILLNINIYFGLIGLCVLMAIVVTVLSQTKQLANDAMLVILAHSTLALGLIVASFSTNLRIDLLSYLYGDILAVSMQDLVWILSVDLLVIGILWIIWRPLLALTVNYELAQVEGVPVKKIKWIMTILMAMFFAVAMKLVGALLITALLIIPASAARLWSKSPEQMSIIASILGVIAVIAGMLCSLQFDWPLGPAIVVAATILFAISILQHKLF